MDLLLVATTILGGLICFDLFAGRFGVDSREPIGDDWLRPGR
jgi:hypothetical protein